MVDFPVALEHAQVWMDEVQGVEAVGECELEGKKCISVYVSLPEAAARLPPEFEGYKVVIEQGGPFRLRRPRACGDRRVRVARGRPSYGSDAGLRVTERAPRPPSV